MNALFANPRVRLAGRALVAGLLAALVQIHAAGDTTIAWRAVVVGAGLAFLEVFTPLNNVVGVGKAPDPASVPLSVVPPPAPPPAS